VAQEIKKLATDSAESVNKIDKIIDDIQADSESLNSEITQVQQVVSEIAKAISHVAGTIQEVGELADKLDKMMIREII
jgi:methyl-accepting chemotaxis protein